MSNRLLAPGRVLGVDTARGLALLGMMSVHIVASTDAAGSVSWAYQVSAGRASALFAVLAGLSLVLATRDRGGGLVVGARRGLLARAGVITLVGLTLGVLDSGVAVILVHYGLLFAVGTLFVGLGTRTLAVTSALWLLVTPVAGHLLRAHLPAGPGPNPSWLSLADPVDLVTTVVVTGYYPVLSWTGYLLAGMVLGRLPLRRPDVAALILATGALLAGGAKVISAALLGPAGGMAHLTVPPSSPVFGRDLATALATGTYGTTPTTSWWWLAVSGPHTGTPLDLLHTTGTSLLVLGACLLLAAALRGRWRWVLLPLAATGSMTLSLYTAHVIVLAATRAEVGGGTGVWLVHAVTAVAVATCWMLTGQRGPLEGLAAQASTAARQGAATVR